MTIGNCFDAVGNLKETQFPNGVIERRTYDELNRLDVLETVRGNTLTTSYLLDKNLPYAQVLAEYENGSLEASYTYGLDLIEQERDGGESYYLVDGLGSTKALTDENGEVTDTYIYDAYGNLIGSAGSTENDYRFAGEQFDETLGQYYLRQRYYDPSSGRFTRRDTWEGRNGEPITLHKYLYANSNPVSYIDPSGLYSLGQFLATIAILGFLIDALNPFNVVAVDPLEVSPPRINALVEDLGARSLRHTQVDLSAISPNSIVKSPSEIRAVIGDGLKATGESTNTLSGLYSYIRQGRGAGFQGVTKNAAQNENIVLRNFSLSNGEVVAAVDISKINSSKVYDLSNPQLRADFLKKYPRFHKMYDTVASESVIAIQGEIPSEAVVGLARISPDASEETKKRIISELFK